MVEAMNVGDWRQNGEEQAAENKKEKLDLSRFNNEEGEIESKEESKSKRRGKLQIEMQKVDINLGSPSLTFPFGEILNRQPNSPSFPFKKLFRRLSSLSA
ncbi:hypothetical protein SDJN02_10141, partial [Cucurbita argyrosperma subsp. argyrosperma]